MAKCGLFIGFVLLFVCIMPIVFGGRPRLYLTGSSARKIEENVVSTSSITKTREMVENDVLISSDQPASVSGNVLGDKSKPEDDDVIDACVNKPCSPKGYCPKPCKCTSKAKWMKVDPLREEDFCFKWFTLKDYDSIDWESAFEVDPPESIVFESNNINNFDSDVSDTTDGNFSDTYDVSAELSSTTEESESNSNDNFDEPSLTTDENESDLNDDFDATSGNESDITIQ